MHVDAQGGLVGHAVMSSRAADANSGNVKERMVLRCDPPVGVVVQRRESGMAGVEMRVQLRGIACELHHGPSSAVIHTVPPKDNGGDGSSFSPTDLLGASLASCALTTMALLAAKEGLTFGDASATVVKHMVGPPRRVGELTVELRMPRGVPAGQRARLEEIAHGCPVAKSLHPDVKVPMTFIWPD